MGNKLYKTNEKKLTKIDAVKSDSLHIQPVDEVTQTFASYVERFELFFVANDVEEDKKQEALLSLIGPNTYNLLRELGSSEMPKDKNIKYHGDP